MVTHITEQLFKSHQVEKQFCHPTATAQQSQVARGTYTTFMLTQNILFNGADLEHRERRQFNSLTASKLSPQGPRVLEDWVDLVLYLRIYAR